MGKLCKYLHCQTVAHTNLKSLLAACDSIKATSRLHLSMQFTYIHCHALTLSFLLQQKRIFVKKYIISSNFALTFRFGGGGGMLSGGQDA